MEHDHTYLPVGHLIGTSEEVRRMRDCLARITAKRMAILKYINVDTILKGPPDLSKSRYRSLDDEWGGS